jgi:hypothetical protein
MTFLRKLMGGRDQAQGLIILQDLIQIPNDVSQVQKLPVVLRDGGPGAWHDVSFLRVAPHTPELWAMGDLLIFWYKFAV